MPRVLFEEPLSVRRPNLLLLALALLPWAAALVFAGLGVLGASGDLLIIAVNLAVFGAFATLGALQGRPFGSIDAVSVRVDEGALEVEGARVPLASITRAVYIPGGVGPLSSEMVRVSRRWGLAVEILVRGRSQAELLLSALGHGAAQRTTPFRARSPLAKALTLSLGYIALVALLASSSFGLLPAAFTPLTLAAAAVFIALQAFPSRVDVGADGLLVRWLWTRRFIPGAQVAYTSRFEEGLGGRYRRYGLHVYVADADPLDLIFGASLDAREERAAFEARVESLLATAPDDLPHVRAALAREGRSVDAWIRDLRALGRSSAGGFRATAFAPAQLLGLLERGDVPADVRAAAAVAFAASPEAPRERVRVVVDAVADPTLRSALDAAAGDDEAALARALDALPAHTAARED